MESKEEGYRSPPREKQKRTKGVQVYLTDDDYALLTEYADEEGLSISAVLRIALFRYLKREYLRR